MSFEVRTISAFEKEFRKLSKKHPSLKSDLFKLIKTIRSQSIYWNFVRERFL